MRTARRLTGVLLALTASVTLGCQTATGITAPKQRTEDKIDFERESLRQQVDQLNRTVRRLRHDLVEAEEALVSAESGLSQNVTRADAVSILAEARILVKRAGAAAPWREPTVAEARTKLEEADRQIKDENFGAAVFFCGRAERLAKGLVEEGLATETAENVSWILAERVNMRAGPSTGFPVVAVLSSATPVFRQRSSKEWTLVRTPRGELGWVFEAFLEEKRP